MISFVARTWRNHGNTLPIPFCQDSFTNTRNSKPIPNQAPYHGFKSKGPIFQRNVFTEMFPQYNVNYDLNKNGNLCNMQTYKMAASLQQSQPRQQKRSILRNTIKSKQIFKDIVVPCSFGEWIILRLMQSMNKPMYLTPQQVEQLISLKSYYTNFDEQGLQNFYNVLIEKSGMNFQSIPMFKSRECLKQALYKAYNANCGNATQLCKFSISARGIIRIEPLDNLKTNNKLPTVNNNDNTHHIFMQGGGDTNNVKLLWKGKNGYIKLESYKSNNPLSEERENLPKLYNVATLDTQHIKNIKEMYELYERGLHKVKEKYNRKKNKLPKWALNIYGYGGNNPNMFFDPKSNQYFSRTKQKHRRLKRKFNTLTYTFNRPNGYVGNRMSEITGTNLKRLIQNQNKTDDGKSNSNQKKNNMTGFNFKKSNDGKSNIDKNNKDINDFNFKKSIDRKSNSNKKNNDINDFDFKKSADGKNNSNKKKNDMFHFKFNEIKKEQRLRNPNFNNIGNRKYQRNFNLNQFQELENEKDETNEWKLADKKDSKIFDEVGAISKMMTMKTRHDKYATLQPGLLAKLYRNAMANKDSVNPEELEALKIYVEQIMPTALSIATFEPKWQPKKQNGVAPIPTRSSVFSHQLKNKTSFEHPSKHRFFKSKKSLRKGKSKTNVFKLF